MFNDESTRDLSVTLTEPPEFQAFHHFELAFGVQSLLFPLVHAVATVVQSLLFPLVHAVATVVQSLLFPLVHAVVIVVQSLLFPLVHAVATVVQSLLLPLVHAVATVLKCLMKFWKPNYSYIYELLSADTCDIWSDIVK
jgi:phage-related protein